MKGMLAIVGLVAFATALFARAVDPIVPPIAAALAVDPATVALLSTAFSLPFAAVQPILGPMADMVGKTRIMTICLFIAVAAAFVGASATNFPILLLSRVVAGMAAGGIFPLALAIIADNVPVHERQVVLGRYLSTTIAGNLLGFGLAGGVADLFGWRAVFVVIGSCGAAALVAAVIGFRNRFSELPARLDFKSMFAGYRIIFANPRAKVCFGAVFIEGVAILGVFPYVAVLLLARGETRSSIAGLILAGFAIGGMFYSAGVRLLLRRLRPRRIMIVGGAAAATALVGAGLGLAWMADVAVFALMGFGFYALHACIQVQATELAPTARGASMSLHSFFFFLGQATGPVLYGFGLAHAGSLPTLAIAAAIMALLGVVCARLLGDRPEAT